MEAVTPSPAILTGKVRPRPPAPIEQVEVDVDGALQWRQIGDWRLGEAVRELAEVAHKPPKLLRKRRT